MNGAKETKLVTKSNALDLSYPAKAEEWSKSKKVVNHKTRQVETRIQRQIVMEDGKVIADSGPQVTQRTKEDVKTEEMEGSSGKGGKGEESYKSIEYKGLPGESVVAEKFETRNTTLEARREQLQYHDESIKELTGYDIHRKALASPNELIQLDNGNIDSSRPKGKLVHYAAKSKKFADREEMKEISKRAKDGTITTEKTITQHHEEEDGDELPEDKVGLDSLPEASKETTKEIQYRKDWNDTQRTNESAKYTTENERRSENLSRYSSMDRKSESRDQNRSASIDRRSTSSQYKGTSSREEEKYRTKEKSVPLEKGIYSPRGSPDIQRDSSLSRSRYGKYDSSYSTAEDKHHSNTQSMSRRDESRLSNRSVASSTKEKPFKEDASVQASFSEDSSDDEAYGRTSSRTRKQQEQREQRQSSGSRSHQVRLESNTYGSSQEYSKSHSERESRPLGTYHFGQETVDKPLRPSHREVSSDRFSSPGRRYETSERSHREREEMRTASSRAEERSQSMKSSMSRSSTFDKSRGRESETVDWFNTADARTLMDELERECQAELVIKDRPEEKSESRTRYHRLDDLDIGRGSRASGEIKGNIKYEHKSSSNGKVINDTSRNEEFQRSFTSPEEREDATRSFNRLMDTTFGKTSKDSLSPLMFDGSIRHIPIERNESRNKSRLDYSRSSSLAREQDYNNLSSTLRRSPYSNHNSRTSSPGRISDRYRFSSSSRSPSRSPERRATFTKSSASPTLYTSTHATNNNTADYSQYKSDLMKKSSYFSGAETRKQY